MKTAKKQPDTASPKLMSIKHQALSVSPDHDQQIAYGNLLMGKLVALGASNPSIRQAILKTCKRYCICNKPTAMYRIKHQAMRALKGNDFTKLGELAKALACLQENFGPKSYQIVEDCLISPVSALAIADVAQTVQQVMNARTN